MNLGTLYRRLAKYELSVSAYEQAYEIGTAVIRLYALVGLIQLSLDKKDYSAVRKWVIKGYTQAKTFDSPRVQVAHSGTVLGMIYDKKDPEVSAKMNEGANKVVDLGLESYIFNV